jgi:predicted nuclease of predicted toxin-antitoxin system
MSAHALLSPPSANVDWRVNTLSSRPALPKLLFDENLPARLVRLLGDVYPGSVHLAELGLLGAADRVVWERAGAEEFVLVTKDEDFHRMVVLFGPPPKVVWVRTGNGPITELARLLRPLRHCTRFP